MNHVLVPTRKARHGPRGPYAKRTEAGASKGNRKKLQKHRELVLKGKLSKIAAVVPFSSRRSTEKKSDPSCIQSKHNKRFRIIHFGFLQREAFTWKNMRVWISSSGGIHPERIGAWISASGGTSWNWSLDFFICISFSKIWIALKTAQDWIEVGFGRGNCGSIKNPDVLAHASLSSRFSVWRSQHVLADMLSAKSYSHYRNECLPKCSRRSTVLVYKWMWDETMALSCYHGLDV